MVGATTNPLLAQKTNLAVVAAPLVSEPCNKRVSTVVITVFKRSGREISILNTKYYESTFEKLRVRKTYIMHGEQNLTIIVI